MFLNRTLWMLPLALLVSCGRTPPDATRARQFKQDSVAAMQTPAPDWSVPAQYRNHLVGSGKGNIPVKAVALTFDDGPSAKITPQILETLRRHHAVATFFVMGQNVKQYPKLVQEEVAEGHVIGYHTYTHDLHPSGRQAEMEMKQTQAVVQQAIGRDTPLFRPPYGNVKSNYTKVAREQNYAVILWNVSSADTATRDSDMVVKNCTAGVHTGDIILMHDSSTKSHTARALPAILASLEQQGFSFVTIPDLLRQSAVAPQIPSISHKKRK